MKKLGLLLLLSAFMGAAVAADSAVSPVVTLCGVKVIQPTERYGDEVYFFITEYPSYRNPKNSQIPEYPLFWPSRYLDKVKNVKLWTGKLEAGQSESIVFSMMDQDAPPWNPDDLLGDFVLKLKNTKGKLVHEWALPNRPGADRAVTQKEPMVFEFKPRGGHYMVTMSLQGCGANSKTTSHRKRR